jgi:hypothetical protein
MKPFAKKLCDGWINVSQMFEGYGGYVYEMSNIWSGHVLGVFAFVGSAFPESPEDLEFVLNLSDGIKWIKEKVTGKPF